MKIEELHFSVRTYNCLKRSRIDTVEQLQVMTDDELKKIRGFGLKCFKEVRQVITQKPAIPGPMESDYNIAELCFRNGEANMKEKVIALLMEHSRIGPEPEYRICHRHIDGIIRQIEKL